MEKTIKALKTSGKVIAVIMKIGYIAMIVAVCICAATLVFTAVTGGETSIVTSDGVTVGFADASATPEEVIALSIEYLVMGVFLFAIFFRTNRMFGEISVTGEPFTKKNVKAVRAIGILIAAMTVAMGITHSIVSSYASVEAAEAYTEAPGIVFGAVVFCLSYIIDYGCALKQRQETE